MKLVILDRDGVINHDSDEYIKSAEEWLAIDGSLEAISVLTHSGFSVVVVSNQAGLGHGLFSIDDLNLIHMKMLTETRNHGGDIEAIFFCPHTPEDNCYCRKPAPGLFDQIAYRMNIHLDGVPYIGDKYSDVEVARRVGARPLLVKTGYGRACLEQHPALDDVTVCEDLADAVKKLIE